MKLVSACLAGLECAYDGHHRRCDGVIELVKAGCALPVCPEQLGGLTTPRPRAEKRNNKVFTEYGIDVTPQFEKGANEALKLAKTVNCTEAIMKANSPSCGTGKIYYGTFSGKLIDGDGVCVELFKKNNIRVITEKELEI
ncbi:MAG: DUF523 domain-containing protein [bacterium]|nr:DUF523 domain-containing protein [bacterium]